jgi:uncharacterized protein (DUF1501 family)
MGGPVVSKRMNGKYPLLASNSNLNVYNGVLIPTTSVDQYFAELALWMGVSSSDLSFMLPNISRFYDVQSGKLPIGFLNF